MKINKTMNNNIHQILTLTKKVLILMNLVKKIRNLQNY